jgi:hypothetical protein
LAPVLEVRLPSSSRSQRAASGLRAAACAPTQRGNGASLMQRKLLPCDSSRRGSQIGVDSQMEHPGHRHAGRRTLPAVVDAVGHLLGPGDDSATVRASGAFRAGAAAMVRSWTRPKWAGQIPARLERAPPSGRRVLLLTRRLSRAKSPRSVAAAAGRTVFSNPPLPRGHSTWHRVNVCCRVRCARGNRACARCRV